MHNLFIRSANRGIGLEFTRQHDESGWRLFVTCRRPAQVAVLQKIAAHKDNISVYRLDVIQVEDMYAITCEMRNISIDLLLNNAGIYPEPDYLGPKIGVIRCFEGWL